ncbi:MAG: MBL fold metallo-hydrolase [Planctomycetes bacterium]|nr:MBL fold metallo-hydrolase [Planctomycetota bacterium]
MNSPAAPPSAALGKDAVIVIDSKGPVFARACIDGIASRTDRRIDVLINTHHHGDHTGGNPEFGREAVIVAHANVRKRLMTPQTMLGRTSQPLPKEGWPVITFDESLAIHFNGEEIRIIHMPHGHTDGDSVIFFTESNVVHMGDDFFAGRFPFVDIRSGGSVQGLTRNIAKVIKQVSSDTKIIPGHGSLSTVDDLKAYHQMLIETTQHVQRAMKSNKTLDEIKAEGFPSKWDEWGSGFISAQRWIESIYNSLSKPPQSGATP